ncbi:hypothetical protein FOA52_010890 [Chlamydomonas sp. UWO 241]|nr:hypothetical protein FOA52_010890 [Chlamydomonas sp. UWO 241]
MSMNEERVPFGTGSGFVWDNKGHVVTNFHGFRRFTGFGQDILKQDLLQRARPAPSSSDGASFRGGTRSGAPMHRTHGGAGYSGGPGGSGHRATQQLRHFCDNEAAMAAWPVQPHNRLPIWGQVATNIQDGYSSMYIFLRSSLWLHHLDTLLVLAMAASSPCFFYYYRLPDGTMMAYRQNWTLVSVLLVFPLTMTLNSVFNRREEAVRLLGVLKSQLLSVFLAHRDWDWWIIPKDSELPAVSGRGRLPPGHVQQVHGEIVGLARVTHTLLTAPAVYRARNYYTPQGRRERRSVLECAKKLHTATATHLSNLSILVEEFKAAGLPANEASRIRQYTTKIADQLQMLRLLKQYRTPVGLRALSRIFVIFLPWLFGPYYADLAVSASIVFSIVFSIVISVALLGLFNVRFELEDPFSMHVPDAVDVADEMGALEADLDMLLAVVPPLQQQQAAKGAQTHLMLQGPDPDGCVAGPGESATAAVGVTLSPPLPPVL